MFLLALSSAVALSSAAAAPVHQTQIARASSTYDASYRTESTLHLTDVAARPAMRQINGTCRWQAELVVNRAVQAQDGRPVAAVGKAIHRFQPISGTYAGRCQDIRGSIAAEVARYSSANQTQAVAVARQDHAVLTAELDSIHAMTAKGG
jgi:hypothetical protein